MPALGDLPSSLRAKIDAQLRKHEWRGEEEAQEIFLVDIWPELENDYETMVDKVRTKYDKLLKSEKIDGMIEGRVKSSDSIRKSMSRRKKQRKDDWDGFREMMDEVHDLAAIRIIVDYPHDLTKISHIITNSKTLCPKAIPNIFLADRPVGTYWAAWFGAYECENHHVEAHYLGDDPVRYYNEVIFEIQITCLPAHLHNKIAHSLHYKGQGGSLSRGDEIVIDLTRGLGLCYSLCLYYKSERLHSDRFRLTNTPGSIFDQQGLGTGFGVMPMKFPNIPGLKAPDVKELPSQLFQEAIKNSSAKSGQEKSGSILDSLVSELSRSITNRQLENRVISKLPFERMGDREGNIEHAMKSTCSWLLDNPMYRDWRTVEASAETRPFFWIKGKAGSGTSQNDNVISFFFSARGEERTTKELYRSILHDLFLSEPVLKKNIGSLRSQDLKRIDQSGWEMKDLREVLSRSLTSRQAKGRLYLLIDALDECDEGEIRVMFTFFEDHKSDTFRMCLASRPYPLIGLAGCHDLVLEGSNHTEDIKAYIHNRLKIFDIPDAEAQSVKDEILKKCSGMFLWVVLVIPLLQKATDRGDGDSVISLMETLKRTPSGLDILFGDILHRDGQILPKLCLAFQWILFAETPLEPQELRAAIHFSQGKEPRNASPEVLKKFVLDTSKGLAEITKSSPPIVQFIHESVREFLLRNHQLYTQGLKGSFQGQSHDILANICLSRIRAPHQTVKDLTDIPLLGYAKEFVFHHSNLAQHFGVRQDKFLSEFPLRLWIEKTTSAPDTTLLYVLAEHGAEYLISIHPDRACHLRLKGGTFSYPLFAAAQKSRFVFQSVAADRSLIRFQSVSALVGVSSAEGSDLRQYFDNMSREGEYFYNDGLCCPIVYLIRFAPYPLLRHILETHQYEAPCSKHGLDTGLFVRKISQEAIIDLCFEFAAKLNFFGRHLRFNTAHDLNPTPKTRERSFWQTFDDANGHSDLIEAGGYTTGQNPEPGFSENPQQSLDCSYDLLHGIFWGGVSSGPTNSFQRRILDARGLEHFQRATDRCPEILYIHLEPNVTLLDLIIEKEFPTVIQLTISMIIETKDDRGAMRAAISAVTARTFSFKSRCNIIRQLVDASFNLDLQILLQHASQPLHGLAKTHMADWRMMEFFVNGFEVLEIDSKFNEEQTILNSLAKGKGTRDPGTIAQLMKYGVNICDINGNGSTILHMLTDTELLAHILATYNIDINAKDRMGNTAILVAADVKAFDRVAVFLNAGADVNVIGNNGSTLLHHCVENEGIISRILGKSKDHVNAINQFGYGVLYAAIEAKAWGTAKRLLNGGARPDITDLVVAIMVEAYECIEALLRSSEHLNKAMLLRHTIYYEKEKMFDIFLADDILAGPTEKEWSELLKIVVNEGKVWFVKRIVSHHEITIDPT
ncbi:hypothetical protein FVEN_g6400 [Fusarium venenatum]|uniref:RelA/SpoT domain-containing protein n=1 Tax=Fusarium venenatum TaxID=56646 RepID=A0A2L2SSQ9_9HYPO|nr:uncharacterized protein FVRRES_04658 [Fusarium venenatum]KAG8355602.1 hypothetical protein FVEN_g6400 [Fusarium venenatum]CEI60222.1 unnamed protein product [Fusarium venenatum]